MNVVKPILFNTEMVRSVLNGQKTVTRRVVRMPDAITSKTVDCVRMENGSAHFSWSWAEAFAGFDLKPPCHTGDTLYVRETWQHGFGGTYLYKASAGYDLFMTADGELVSDIPWRPSIHMPREAARIFLVVTDVRVERLQDIDDAQANAEGAAGISCGCEGSEVFCSRCCNTGWITSPRSEFAGIWNSTIKPTDRARYGWEANPWVWGIAFKRNDKPEEVNFD